MVSGILTTTNAPALAWRLTRSQITPSFADGLRRADPARPGGSNFGCQLIQVGPYGRDLFRGLPRRTNGEQLSDYLAAIGDLNHYPLFTYLADNFRRVFFQFPDTNRTLSPHHLLPCAYICGPIIVSRVADVNPLCKPQG